MQERKKERKKERGERQKENDRRKIWKMVEKKKQTVITTKTETDGRNKEEDICFSIDEWKEE